MSIRPDRLIGDLRVLAEIGKYQTSVHRPAFSAEDIAAREWLRDKLIEVALTAEIDGVGNLYGRMANAEKAVIVGSHSDTVSYGGRLDGVLGVIYGLEIARCVAESSNTKLGVDVMSLQDEEGSYLGLMARAYSAKTMWPRKWRPRWFGTARHWKAPSTKRIRAAAGASRSRTPCRLPGSAYRAGSPPGVEPQAEYTRELLTAISHPPV